MKVIKKNNKRINNIFIKKHSIYLTICAFILLCGVGIYIKTFSEFVVSTSAHITGVENTTIYLNDLEADWYYYTGLNYTESSTGILPTTIHKNLYSDSNLVETTVTYNGNDITGNYHGYVSVDDNYDKYVYYKYYVVNNNGTTSDTTDDYIEIELIDNPFSKRPIDKAFNGWISNYYVNSKKAVIRYDYDDYVRYAKVPVSYTNDKPNDIEITFNANWVDASVGYVGSNSWSNAFTSLLNTGMQEVPLTIEQYSYPSVAGYYVSDTITTTSVVSWSWNGNSVNTTYGTCTECYTNNGRYYGSGAGAYATQYTCPAPSTNGVRPWYGQSTTVTNDCTVYYKQDSGDTYSEFMTYYRLNNNRMTVITLTPTYLGTITNPDYTATSVMAGYYKKVTIARNASIAGYYDSNGVYQTSGTCPNNSCTYYDLVQYYDSSGNVENYNSNNSYFYLVTRDTNIVVMDSDMSTSWSSSESKPFTLTSVYNDDDYRDDVTWTVEYYYDYYNSNGVSVNCYNDTRIEYIKIDSEESLSNQEPTASNYYGGFLYGNWYNVKLGRGISQNGSNANFVSVLGGNDSSTGSSSGATKYRLTIESGNYSSISLTSGASTSSYSNYSYVDAFGLYGNDYDRALNNNSDLIVYYCAAGSWSRNYGSTNTTSGIMFSTNVKSGSFGTSHYDLTTGIYIGGRYGGVHDSAKKIKIDGGVIYGLIGGPLTNSSREDYNDTYAYVTGGVIDFITAGAGTTATYGNRIVQVTGGTINYSVFGGSNGNDASEEEEGTLNGTSYVYIGGTAEIGSETNVNNNNVIYGAEAGSVFGIGNGKDGYEKIGSCDNSIVFINDEAVIRRNVYGGGNYGATGIVSSSNTNRTDIFILGGDIKGSVYGGGNNNGAGLSTKISTINIKMTGGLVEGSVYGGANALGTIHGSTNVTIDGGIVNGSVYGGGRGGTSNNEEGTFVSRNVDVKIGTIGSSTTPLVRGYVFGGSAYGTVNGTTQTTTLNQEYTTKVTLNKGTVETAIFGGGQGDNNSSYIPYVEGNIIVDIKGGTVATVYGGNDAKGTPNGSSTVNIDGGTVTIATYGGGRQTGIATSNVNLKSGSSTLIFGGSNQSGNVTTSNISTIGGTTTTIYGGNNVAGVTSTANVNIDGGTIGTVYGGGKDAETGITYISLESSTVGTVYGGGESAPLTTSSNITLEGSSVGTIYGGSNVEDNVPNSYIDLDSGTVGTVYGGNNQGGRTVTTHITSDGASVTGTIYGGGNSAPTTTSNVIITTTDNTIPEIYGGGNREGVTTTNVNINGGSMTSIYGGSNHSGNVTTSNVTATSGTISDVYGGNNDGGLTTTARVIINGSIVTSAVYGGGEKTSTGESFVTITTTGNTIPLIFGGGNEASVTTTHVTLNGGSATTVHGGSNLIGTVTNSNVIANSGTFTTIYGGNNDGGSTTNTNVDILGGTINYVYGGGDQAGVTTSDVDISGSLINDDVYGGGNEATVANASVYLSNSNVLGNVYGGGNQAGVTTSDVDVLSSTVTGNVFGGGNAGIVSTNTDLYVSSSTIGSSVYGGGNGATAVVHGNTVLNIDGTTNITNHVFGGGNAAATGTSDNNNSTTTVNIAGATIGGNVYGGANTSVVYGVVNVNIGTNVVNVQNLNANTISIAGTVFGGGEANASGNENYDYTFISVTTGINIKIDASNHANYTISGSIFGSGNASSTSGYSYIDIKNYGTEANKKTNVSIQRASIVTIDNSVIELLGATDRTNEYSAILFTFSRIKRLKLKNNSTLYLKTGTNLLEKLDSLVDINDVETKASITIDDDNDTISRNVLNSIYMYEGKNLNIATNQNITEYGDVSGMTFFGMYVYDRENVLTTAMFNNDYDYGDTVTSNDLYYFSSGSYALGAHKTNHNYNEDGFYSNKENPDAEGTMQIYVIEPTPELSNYYMWIVGETVTSYNISLTASKYSTLGTYEMPLINFSTANTIFTVVGFNYNGLDSDISLVSSNNIPRVASTTAIADTTMGLAMKTSNTGWSTNGETEFLTNMTTPYTGTVDYLSENSSIVPSLIFYLYHSKNIASSDNMGTVVVSLIASTPVDDLNYESERLNITIELSRALYVTNDYEGSLAPGKKYEMFASESTKITSSSSLSAYYSLFSSSNTSIYRTGYHRVLTSSFVLPLNTKITMIDFASSTEPEYYYYVVNQNDVNTAQTEYNIYNEATYPLTRFIRMGSSSPNNNYNDAANNLIYYDSNTSTAEEEFIFIVDFSESNINVDSTNNLLLLELRDSGGQTLTSVLGIQHSNMQYDVYYNKDSVIDVSGRLSTNNLYLGKPLNLTVTTDFVQQYASSIAIYDTRYMDNKLGIKLSIYDSNNNKLSGLDLLGLSFTYHNTTYYPREDGTIRFKIADRVANVSTRIEINTENTTLSSGTYTILIESFGSPDGIYYGNISSDTTTVSLNILNTMYGLQANVSNTASIIDHITGNGMDNSNALIYTLNYSSALSNPNIRISLYRRDYTAIYTTSYLLVDYQDYSSIALTSTNNPKEYMLLSLPSSSNTITLRLNQNLTTGTYKLRFSLYDGDSYIGNVEKNMIIK